MNNVAFIGLGVMGYPMAGHLSRAGYTTAVYNRTGEKARRWCEDYTGTACATPAAAAAEADAVFLCVGRDEDVREVTTGEEGVLSTLRAGSLLVDHTTTSADLARELDERCRQQGARFVDAPVSGGQQGAEAGRLTAMCGGDEEAFRGAAELIEHFAASVKYLGPAGSGQLCKMVNQVCIAGVLQGLAEGLAFARRSGLDPEDVVDVISRGAAQSWQMENRHKTMLAGHYDHGFAVDWMRKDLGIVLDAARDNGTPLPLTALVDQFYGDVQAMGGGRWDTSSLLARLENFLREKQA